MSNFLDRLASLRTLKPVDKSRVTPSKRVKMTDRGSECQIDVSWRSSYSYFMATFAVLWSSISGIAAWAFLTQKVSPPPPIWVKGMILLFCGIGIAMAIEALRHLFNTTTIIIKSGRFHVWAHPFAVASPQTYSISQISNFTLQRVKGGEKNGERVYKHFLNIQFTNGDHVKLCPIENMNAAIYLEKLLETRLGITDNPELDQIAI